MNDLDYDKFYDRVGKINGWDFSKINVLTEGVKWDYQQEILKRAHPTNLLLDIGSGGGENLETLAAFFAFIVGIDQSGGMIKTAQKNSMLANNKNIRFCQMSSSFLQFPHEFFDIVTCRHAPFHPEEVAKVLKKGGYFITQQVSEADKLNIKQAFHHQHKDINGRLQARYIDELKHAGFSIVRSDEYNATEYYQSPEDLLFLLKHTPIIPHFAEEKHHFKIFEEFLTNNTTSRGICTNSNRFLIIAKK